MKINPAAFRAYNKINEYSSSSRHAELSMDDAAQRLGNMDQIEISPEGARKIEAEQLARTVESGLRGSASPERLEQLQKAIQENSYYVPTGDLVDAVMRHWAIV